MSSADYFASSHDRAELGDELRQAFHELNFDGAEETEPADGDALLGVRFTGSPAGADLEERAEELRTALAALLTGGPSVSFKLAQD